MPRQTSRKHVDFLGDGLPTHGTILERLAAFLTRAVSTQEHCVPPPLHTDGAVLRILKFPHLFFQVAEFRFRRCIGGAFQCQTCDKNHIN